MKKILIIEDHQAVRENLEEILMLANYQVVSAENGKTGVETALKELPDLILCDVMMPELDGYGVLHILSRTPATADIPFIFLTAKADKEDFRKGMTLGADDYIPKPFDHIQLLATIEARLKKSERLNLKAQPDPGASPAFVNKSLAMKAIQNLAGNRELRRFRKRDPIFMEGDYPRWLYFIQSGKVKLFKTNDRGKEFITRIVGKGEFMGYLCILNDTPYIESAMAVDECEIAMVPREEFSALVYNNKDVAVMFVHLLTNLVANQEELLINLAYDSVRKRVANTLVQLSNGKEEEIHLLREDLASLTGTAKETVIRTLSDFKDEQLIDTTEHSIKILNFKKLQNMPN